MTSYNDVPLTLVATQVMTLYQGLHGKLEAVIERAAQVDARVADEQDITARVAARALETVDGLLSKVDDLDEALGGYEEEELWPRVVNAFVQEWKPDAGSRHGASKEEIVANAMDDLIANKIRDLETGLESLDEDFARRLDKMVMKEATEKAGLETEIEAVWRDIQEQFTSFERETGLLESAMDRDLSAQRATLLQESDNVQQDIYGLDKKMIEMQKDTAEVERNNAKLSEEVAERLEELETMAARLKALK